MLWRPPKTTGLLQQLTTGRKVNTQRLVCVALLKAPPRRPQEGERKGRDGTGPGPDEGSRRQEDGVRMRGRQRRCGRDFSGRAGGGKKHKRGYREDFFSPSWKGSFIKAVIYERKGGRGREGVEGKKSGYSDRRKDRQEAASLHIRKVEEQRFKSGMNAETRKL